MAKEMELPEDMRLALRASAKTLLGSGYVDEYYDSAASEFRWAYFAGYKAGRAAKRKVKSKGGKRNA